MGETIKYDFLACLFWRRKINNREAAEIKSAEDLCQCLFAVAIRVGLHVVR